MNQHAQLASKSTLATYKDKLHTVSWERIAVLYARFAVGTAFLSAVAGRFGLWERTLDLKHFSNFMQYAGEVLSFMPASTIPYFAWMATVCETSVGILLILGLWPRVISIASAILLGLFGTAMAISFGLKSPMDYSVFSASGAARPVGSTRLQAKCYSERRTIPVRRQWERIALVAVLCITTFNAATLLAQKQDDVELLRARETVWRAWFAGDIRTLGELVPPGTVVMSGGEKEWKHQVDVLRSSAEFHSKGGKLVRLEFPRTEIQHFSDVAIVWSSYIVETEVNGKRSLGSSRVTEIFVWQHGRWINPGWHTDEEK